jgi:hypothetical protein
MSTISMADGQAIEVKHASLTYAQLRGIVFENTAVPQGVPISKATGNPPAWIEFDASITSNAQTVSIKQANIVAISP